MPRPKSFDPDTVLAKAMVVFWEKGYDAASISDLTEAMGINRFSLYDTFGDKHQLYLKALDAYTQRVVEPMVEKINQIQSINDIQQFFETLIDYQHSCDCSPCCMMHKAAVSLATVDQAAKERIEHARTRLHSAFFDALERINRKGELCREVNLHDGAWILKIMMGGFASHASAPIPKDEAKSAVCALLARFRA